MSNCSLKIRAQSGTSIHFWSVQKYLCLRKKTCRLLSAALTFQLCFSSTHFVCCFSCVVCSSICVCVFPLSLFPFDLDCPVVWGSSGLLLFSCSLRYLFHCLAPFAFKLSPLLLHYIVLDPRLTDSRFETNADVYCLQIHSTPHMSMCAHTPMLLEIT